MSGVARGPLWRRILVSRIAPPKCRFPAANDKVWFFVQVGLSLHCTVGGFDCFAWFCELFLYFFVQRARRPADSARRSFDLSRFTWLARKGCSEMSVYRFG